MARERERVRGGYGGWLVLAALAGFGGLMKATMVLGPVSVPIWFAVVGGGAFVLRGPLGKALAARISGELPEATGPVELPEELYVELDELRTRVAELEERQDFSERLLARREEPPAAG
jgi:hypothetical protein